MVTVDELRFPVHRRRARCAGGMLRWCVAVVFVWLAIAAPAANARVVTLPQPEISPPVGASVVREVQAGGVQVYSCRAASDGALGWTLVGPKAVLVNDDGSDFGTHSAGPTWTATDGSSIVGDGAHPLAKIDRTDSVPAMLLAVKTSSGSGILTGVRFVRRSDTEGGVALAAGCDAAHADSTIARRYTAVYTFYR